MADLPAKLATLKIKFKRGFQQRQACGGAPNKDPDRDLTKM